MPWYLAARQAEVEGSKPSRGFRNYFQGWKTAISEIGGKTRDLGNRLLYAVNHRYLV